jgi:hypothetical protein
MTLNRRESSKHLLPKHDVSALLSKMFFLSGMRVVHVLSVHMTLFLPQKVSNAVLPNAFFTPSKHRVERGATEILKLQLK